MKHKLLLTTFAAFAAVASANAAILFDFGTTPATGQTVVNALTSPSGGGPAGLTGNITYNTISGTDSGQNASFPASYQDSSGATVPGLSVATFTGTAWNAMNSATAPYVRVGWAPVGRGSQGVFARAQYADFMSATNTSTPTNDYLGMSFSGLAAGQYTVYLVSNNTYNASTGANEWEQRVGVGGANVTDFSSFTSQTLNWDYTNIVADTASWAAAEGKYWESFTVTLAAGQTLYIGATKGAGSQGLNQEGVINAVQIVPVPEPTTYAILAGLAALGLAVYRRRNRQ